MAGTKEEKRNTNVGKDADGRRRGDNKSEQDASRRREKQTIGAYEPTREEQKKEGKEDRKQIASESEKERGGEREREKANEIKQTTVRLARG